MRPLAKEVDARHVRTDATKTEDLNAALAEPESLAPLRISADAHGGPASGGRLIGKDGSPLAGAPIGLAVTSGTRVSGRGDCRSARL